MGLYSRESRAVPVCRVAAKNSSPARGLPECPPGSEDAAAARDTETVDFETALDLAGYGRFSAGVLCACACAFFTTGVQNALPAYALPAAGCELRLSTYRAGLVNVAFMCGGVASAFLWGIVADVIGRKKTLIFTLLLDAVVTGTQSTVQEFSVLVSARAANGFLIGGPSTLVMSYLSDLVGKKRRQLFLNITGLSFTLAWLVLPAVAWLVIPYKSHHSTWLSLDSWRLYFAVCSIPGFVSGLWVLFLPESPRFLLNTERADQAMKILADIYSVNTGRPAEEYPVKKLIPDQTPRGKILIKNQVKSKVLLLDVLKQMKCLVSRTHATKAALIAFVFFANMAAGFGLSMWIPELLVRMKLNKETAGLKCGEILATPRTILNASFTETLRANATDSPFNYNTIGVFDTFNKSKGDLDSYGDNIHHTLTEYCKEELDAEVYESGLLVGACCVLGNVACACACALGGRGVRRAASACAAVCAAACLGACACVCACAGTDAAAVAAVSTLNAAALNGNVLLLRLLLHALPPRLSALGLCWGAWWGRAGGLASNLAIGALLDVSCSAPFIAVAALLALSAAGIMMVTQADSERLEPSLGPLELAGGGGGAGGVADKEHALDKYVTTHM